MERRTVLLGMAGMVGAGVSLRWSQARTQGAAAIAGKQPASAPAPLRLTTGTAFKSVTLAQVPIGGGGFVTGIDVSADGERFVCRTDVANAYVRGAKDPAWLPLFSPATMAREDYDPLPAFNDKADGQGVAGIRIAPTNKNLIVASYHGYIWKSVDGGRSIRRTSSPQIAMPSNTGGQRLFNRTIDIHPTNADLFLVGTYGEGAWYTGDGGRRWRRCKLPDAGKSHDNHPGIHLVLFDPKSSKRTYVFVTGRGLFLSEEGPQGEFKLLEGGPTHVSSMVAGPDGAIYLAEHTSGQSGGLVWRHRPGTAWASGKPGYEAFVLAVDPRNPSFIVASNPNGFIMYSSDGGLNWTSVAGAVWQRDAGEVGWTRGLITFFPSEMRFDPKVENRLWIAQGVGVADGTFSPSRLQVSDWSSGIEELCAVDTLAVPGGKLFLSAWDKSFWRVDHDDVYGNDFRYPLRPGRSHSADLVAYGSFMDYAGDDPNFLVGVIATSDAAAPGFTRDGGQSWQAFEGTPPEGWGYGGCIAASTRQNIILLPSNNGIGAFTLDGGKSWSSIKLDGVNPTGGFANAFYVRRKNVSADKTRPGTFTLVYTTLRNDQFGEPLGGVWTTRDGGRSWSQILKGVINPGNTDPREVSRHGLDARQFWQCELDYVPGRTGELVYTPHADFKDDRFFWSQDDGKTWAELHRSIRTVRTFGFGKALQGQARPALYFWGAVQGREGLYASFDWFASEPRLVTAFPSQMLARISSVAGDLDRVGRVYVGTSCAGWIKVDVEV